jgi:glycosyltransferase involved in cell wall biosynthesis
MRPTIAQVHSDSSSHDPLLSVVAPAHNEEQNLRPLVAEIVTALRPLGLSHEVVIVDDGSTDATPRVLRELMREHAQLRALRMMHTSQNRGHGQSAAFHAGFRATRGSIIAVLDADLQNDPADIPAMLEMLRQTGADLVQGDRSYARADNLVRKGSSWVGRFFRRTLLGDVIRDTGCSLRVMKRELALAIPLEFRGMHRFIPITAHHLGFKVVEMPVNHRPRVAGKAKYGIVNRAIPGLIDCVAVRWMANRRRPTLAQALHDLDADALSRGVGEDADAPAVVVEYDERWIGPGGAQARAGDAAPASTFAP